MALVGMGLMGFMNPITNGPLFALLQAKIAPEMQGRVFTVVGSLAGAMSPLGLLLAAPVADLLGIRFWFWIAGAACVMMAAGGLLLRQVRDLEFSSAKDAPAPEVVMVGAPAQD
jgi:DHA3 family macrolide efflux protein-like MFS transporter